MDNQARDEGQGLWTFRVYKPKGLEPLGPFEGHLIVDNRMYTVRTGYAPQNGRTGTTVVAVPSQNVAYVQNTAENSEENE